MIVHNPTETPVRDYPIQDPKTKEVSLWGIEPGETLDFPDHVGAYLVEVYGFLQRVITQEQLDYEREESAKLAQGKHFEPVKVISPGGVTNAMVQTPPPTAEELKPENNPSSVTKNPPQAARPQFAPDMVGAVVGDESDKAAGGEIPQAKSTSAPKAHNPVSETPSGKLVCPECRNSFQNKAALKTHYAHAHLKVPGID